jgi:2-polyprenyl-3-methyl-5-hydroxy-6-metoxy-1,4-benzoquinol methylase
MNKLEQEIWDKYGSFELSHDKNKLIVENINEFVKKHCKAFAEFYFINEFNSSKEDCLTTEQLFKLYIEKL